MQSLDSNEKDVHSPPVNDTAPVGVCDWDISSQSASPSRMTKNKLISKWEAY